MEETTPEIEESVEEKPKKAKKWAKVAEKPKNTTRANVIDRMLDQYDKSGRKVSSITVPLGTEINLKDGSHYKGIPVHFGGRDVSFKF